MQEKEPIYNWCHDKIIEEVAQALGITEQEIINKARSIGEGPYNSIDVALEYLERQANKNSK